MSIHRPTETSGDPYFVSVGRPDALDKDVGFYFQGRWSEFSERSLVPLELARKAARQFLSTGQRPDVVEWEEV